MIYLDNAATSWPKFPGVMNTIDDFVRHSAGNPGRGGHAFSLKSARLIWHVRDQLARFFEAPDPEHLVFTMNATQALNQAILGLLAIPVYTGKPTHVVTTTFEHNAVMRPLRHLEAHGLQITQVHSDPEGRLDMRALKHAFRRETRLVVLIHASNVIGTIFPVNEVAEIAHGHGVPVLLDSSQSAGLLPVGLKTSNVDLIAFTGHKGLHGPTGTGGLVISEQMDPTTFSPLMHGGTGFGHVTTGGTESNITALWIAKKFTKLFK